MGESERRKNKIYRKKPKSLALYHLGSFLGFSRLVIIVTSSVKKKSFEFFDKPFFGRCPPR